LVSEEASLSEDAPLQPDGQVLAGLARDRDESRLGGVLVLAVATTRPAEHPAVILDESDDLADLHPTLHLLGWFECPEPTEPTGHASRAIHSGTEVRMRVVADG